MSRRTRVAFEPPVFTFRVRILGGGYAPPNCERIWREIEIAANQTLAELGDAIPVAFEFADPHLWSFFRNGRAWDPDAEFTRRDFTSGLDGEIPRDRDAKRVLLREFPLPGITGKKEFLYVFDYGDEWHFGVKLVHKRDTVDPTAAYPRVVAGEGASPPQYPEVDDDEPDPEASRAMAVIWPNHDISTGAEDSAPGF